MKIIGAEIILHLPGKIVGSNIHIFSFQIHSLAASSDIKFKCDMS